MVASKLLGVVGIFLVVNYAAVNGRCLKASTGGRPRCPPTWSQWHDKCYKKHNAEVAWQEGKQICVDMSAVMVVPQSEEELQHLFNMDGKEKFWIGCTDIQTEGTWVCLDGDGTIDVQDKRWDDGQPNNWNGNQDCARAGVLGWNDKKCSDPYKIICQRPVSPAL